MAAKNYTVPFSIGDVVFYIVQRSKQTFINCPLCDGHGRIKIKEESRNCPDCYGRKGTMEYGLEEWSIHKDSVQILGVWHETTVSKFTIGQVRLEHTKRNKPKFSAMCVETGIGSGSVYDMENFFSSQEEAENECIKRNK
jgi:hypothetical protein